MSSIAALQGQVGRLVAVTDERTSTTAPSASPASWSQRFSDLTNTIEARFTRPQPSSPGPGFRRRACAYTGHDAVPIIEQYTVQSARITRYVQVTTCPASSNVPGIAANNRSSKPGTNRAPSNGFSARDTTHPRTVMLIRSGGSHSCTHQLIHRSKLLNSHGCPPSGTELSLQVSQLGLQQRRLIPQRLTGSRT
ncbi:hypothetical protein, partial [Actinoplanes palleronii]|uniref:hypothetical protein n=1 Tax=Actinoplanes palleronii TaxID=113570 RepID=UPI0019431580